MINITLTARLTCDKCGLTGDIDDVPAEMVSLNRVPYSPSKILALHSRSWKRIQCDNGAYWEVCGDCAKELDLEALNAQGGARRMD